MPVFEIMDAVRYYFKAALSPGAAGCLQRSGRHICIRRSVEENYRKVRISQSRNLPRRTEADYAAEATASCNFQGKRNTCVLTDKDWPGINWKSS
jgi:hypothetical protein